MSKRVLALASALVASVAVLGLSLTTSGATADVEATGKVQISRVERNVPGVDTASNAYKESVRVKNLGVATVSVACPTGGQDMTNWTLEDLTGHTYRFPNGYCLKNNAEVSVRTGRSPSADPLNWWNNKAFNLYWNRTHHMYGNNADGVVLQDNNGIRVDRTSWNPYTILP